MSSAHADAGIFVSGSAYRLGRLVPISELDRTEPAVAPGLLADYGVESYSRFVEPVPVTAIAECAAFSIAGLDPSEIDAVVVVTESFSEFLTDPPEPGMTPLRSQRNRVLQALAALGLVRAPVFAVTYGGSSNFVQAMLVTRSLIRSGDATMILVVCAERQPTNVSRFMQASVAMTGDGIATCVVGSHRRPGYQLEYVGISRFAPPRDPTSFTGAVLEMYRSAKVVAAGCYQAVGRSPSEYDWLVLNNYNVPTTNAFGTLMGFAEKRVYAANAARTGHIPSCDALINLTDLHPLAAASAPVMFFANGPVSCGAISLRRL